MTQFSNLSVKQINFFGKPAIYSYNTFCFSVISRTKFLTFCFIGAILWSES